MNALSVEPYEMSGSVSSRSISAVIAAHTEERLDNISLHTYATRVLPNAVLRELRPGMFGSNAAAFERCAMVVVSVTVIVAGWLVEMASGTKYAPA